MTDRSFLAGLLTTALVAIVSITWLAAPQDPHLPRLAFEDAHNKEFTPQNPDCEVSSINALPSSKRASKLHSCAESREDYRLRVNDLVQQTRAADAAQSQSSLAFTTAWLAFAQTIGGVLTLIAAFAAAKFARDAAFETKRAADAAHDELQYAKEVSVIQLRAQIAILDAVLEINTGEDKDDFPFNFKVTFKNFGQTLASQCLERSAWVLGGGTRKEVLMGEKFGNNHSVAPGDILLLEFALELSQDQLSSFVSGEEDIKYFGQVKYTDEFNNINSIDYYVEMKSGKVTEYYTSPSRTTKRKSFKSSR